MQPIGVSYNPILSNDLWIEEISCRLLIFHPFISIQSPKLMPIYLELFVGYFITYLLDSHIPKSSSNFNRIIFLIFFSTSYVICEMFFNLSISTYCCLYFLIPLLTSNSGTSLPHIRDLKKVPSPYQQIRKIVWF